MAPNAKQIPRAVRKSVALYDDAFITYTRAGYGRTAAATQCLYNCQYALTCVRRKPPNAVLRFAE